MKNKKGFTLVELLAVVVVISIVMIVAIPSVQKALTSSKEGISAINRKNIEEAAKTLATEIIYCDNNDDNSKLFAINNVGTSCTTAKTNLTNGINLKLTDLTSNGYFDDPANNCSCTDTNEENCYIKIISNDDAIDVTIGQSVTCKK